MDGFFDEKETKKLKDLFGVESDSEFLNVLQKVTHAALSEYKQMFLGMGMPSRAEEIQQYRLYYLIKHYFGETMPSEAEVSAMFQLTQPRSRSLIRSVVTRFRFDLEQELLTTLKETIENAELEDGEYHVVIRSNHILDELNQIIETEAPDLDPIRKVRNKARTYCISEDSCDTIRKALEI